MNCLQAFFSHRHIVLPVIHVVNGQQALQNAWVAYETGADGVFLINHEVDGKRPLTYNHLLDIHNEVTQALPDWWLGLNCLDLEPHETFQHLPPQVAGLWVDNAMIDERQAAQPEAERIKAGQTESQWSGLYFGGVAFKYQRDVMDVSAAAQTAVAYTDIITTSGFATGQAAALTKIPTMRAALGDHPLDPTGCGDAFQAAFVVSCWQTGDIEVALQQGAEQAAIIFQYWPKCLAANNFVQRL